MTTRVSLELARLAAALLPRVQVEGEVLHLQLRQARQVGHAREERHGEVFGIHPGWMVQLEGLKRPQGRELRRQRRQLRALAQVQGPQRGRKVVEENLSELHLYGILGRPTNCPAHENSNIFGNLVSF